MPTSFAALPNRGQFWAIFDPDQEGPKPNLIGFSLVAFVIFQDGHWLTQGAHTHAYPTRTTGYHTDTTMLLLLLLLVLLLVLLLMLLLMLLLTLLLMLLLSNAATRCCY